MFKKVNAVKYLGTEGVYYIENAAAQATGGGGENRALPPHAHVSLGPITYLHKKYYFTMYRSNVAVN